MKFVRAIWKLLVGIKDALVLVVMLCSLALLYAGLVGPAGAGEGRRSRPQFERQRGRTACQGRMGRTSLAGRGSISTGYATW